AQKDVQRRERGPCGIELEDGAFPSASASSGGGGPIERSVHGGGQATAGVGAVGKREAVKDLVSGAVRSDPEDRPEAMLAAVRRRSVEDRRVEERRNHLPDRSTSFRERSEGMESLERVSVGVEAKNGSELAGQVARVVRGSVELAVACFQQHAF